MRRHFTQSALIAMVRRASDKEGRIHCERCGEWCRKRADYDFDHVIAEELRPAADKKRKLTAADGQLLCVAQCHPGKTKADKQAIARAKRREARSLGIRARRKINWGHEPKEPKPLTKRAHGPPRLAREYET